jgi:hypothetical protein
MGLTPSTQPPCDPVPAAFFVWEPAGKRIAVHLNGEFVDVINYMVMRGFGALPKRGAEVGGLLLGTVEKGERTVVRIEEFIGIPCSHLHGPSYILSEEDLPALDRKLAAYAADSGARLRVVGYFRSHTREPLQLVEADMALLNSRFPDEDAICLLVKPFTTRPSEAVFLARENGKFDCEPQYETFVFRRKEMHLLPPTNRERVSTAEPQRPAAPEVEETRAKLPAMAESSPSVLPTTGPVLADEPELDVVRMGRPRLRRVPRPETGGGQGWSEPAALRQVPQSPPTWYGENREPAASVQTPEIQQIVRRAPASRYWKVWLSLSMISLLLGGLIGVALTLSIQRWQSLALHRDPYGLELGVSRLGESFHLRWNPDMPALRQALSGELLIEEGKASKTQPLSAEDLSRGGIIYRGASSPVRFRLTLFLRDRAEFSAAVVTGHETHPQAR